MKESQLFRREERIWRFVLWGLKASTGAAVAWALAYGRWELFFYALLALVLMFLPEMIESRIKIELPVEFDLVIVVFMYMSIFLGEAIDAYEHFWWWDALLHISSGVILGFAGFLLLYVKVRQQKLSASPWLIGLIIFCFGVAFGAVWEIFEFAVDSIFGTNMQKSGLQDTMWDMIVDAVGSLAMAIVGGKYVASGGKGFLHQMLRKFLELNPRFSKKTRVQPERK